MTRHNEEMVPMTSANKGLLRSKAFWGATAGVIVVLVAGLAGTKAIKHVDQRIAQLEQAQKALTPQDRMNSMADVVQTHAKQLKRLAERQDLLTRQIGGLTLSNELTEKLKQQLQAQQVELNALKDSLESVKKSATEKSAPTVAPLAPEPAATPATAKITPKHKPTSIKSSPRNSVRRVARKAPFVLTGVEQRGTSSFAALAPQGFSDLSQVRLIGEGESVAGWTLVSVGHGQATFRVNGRLQTVSAQ